MTPPCLLQLRSIMHPKTRAWVRLSSVLFAFALLTATRGIAGDGTWTLPSNGSWDLNTNWSGNTIANGAGFTATFQYGLPNTTSSVISVDTARTIGNLSFIGDATNGTHNITLNGPQALTLSTGTATAPSITVNMASRTITLNTVLAGTEGVRLTNTTGTLILGGANTYTGLTSVLTGTVIANHHSAFGSTTGDTTVSNGAAIELNHNITVTGETLTLAGSGGANGPGALRAASNATAEWAGPIKLNGSTRVAAGGNTANSAILRLSGVIANGSSAGSLLVTGAGTVIVSAANTYTGTTQVIRGTLKLDGGNDRLPTGTILDVWGAAAADNAVFDLNGYDQSIAGLTRNTIVGTSTVTNSAGTASILTLNTATANTYSGNLTGNLSIVKEGTSTQTLSGNNSYSGNTTITAGTLVISSAYLNDNSNVLLTTGGTLELNFAGIDSIYRLYFDGVAQSIGTWGSLSSTATNKSAFFTGTGVLNVIAVPEPGTFGTLVMGLFGCLLVHRWRNRNHLSANASLPPESLP